MPHNLKWYTPGRRLKGRNKMGPYDYKLTYKAGTHLRDGGIDEHGNPIRYNHFRPAYTPAKILKMGAFEGKYLNDSRNEFPIEWYKGARMVAPMTAPDPSLNRFKIKSRMSLQHWRDKGWIESGDPDERGWFQWYCRYWLGRRVPHIDKRQIRRWMAYGRHYAQVIKHAKGDTSKRRKQRQGLLQWSWPATD